MLVSGTRVIQFIHLHKTWHNVKFITLELIFMRSTNASVECTVEMILKFLPLCVYDTLMHYLIL